MRSPYQVLVIPYYKGKNGIEFSVFHRSDDDVWQAISGGGEEGETKLESAVREAFEEANIPRDSNYIELDTISSIPSYFFADSSLWDDSIYVVYEYCYGVEIKDKNLKLSSEHSDYKWLNYEDVLSLLKWDSNKTAIWELNKRLT